MMLPGSIDALNPQPGKVSPNRLPFFAKWKGKHVWSLQPMVVPISHLEFNSPKTINLTGFKSKIHNGDYDPRQGSKMSHLSTYKQIHTHIVTIQDVYIYICIYIYIHVTISQDMQKSSSPQHTRKLPGRCLFECLATIHQKMLRLGGRVSYRHQQTWICAGRCA